MNWKSREIRKFRKTYAKYTFDCISEGYTLAVLFDEKDEVKKMGARWNPDSSGQGGHWWMPEKHLADTIQGTVGTETVWEWLNEHEMIVGQYGKIDAKSHILDNLEDADEYELYHSAVDDYTAENTGHFHVWENIGIVGIVGFVGWAHADTDMSYMTLEDGRSMWDDLMKSGYRMIIREKTLTPEEDAV